jgi:Zn-dependent protease
VSQYDPYSPDPYRPREAEEPQATYSPVRHPLTARDILRKLWAPIAAFAFLLWKLKFVLFAIFKFKAFATVGTMLVSIGAYALLWGWRFAVGFVLLLLVHELGHALEAKRQGLPVSAPMFIPFLGALILLKQAPKNSWEEVKIAIAGPIVGTVGAAACWGLGAYLDSDLLRALAFTGFFLNLFNLVPLGQLDGGRIAYALHPAFQLVGFVLMLGLFFLFPNPILILILLLGGFDAWHRWRKRNTPEMVRYREMTTGRRVATGVMYFGLMVLLSLAMSSSHVERDL